MVEFEQRPDDTSGTVSLGMRRNYPVDVDGEGTRTFEIPEDDLSESDLQRLLDVGHRPTDPDSLPEGVSYNSEGGADSSEKAESDSVSDPEEDEPEDPSEPAPTEEAAEEEPEVPDESEESDSDSEPELDEEFSEEALAELENELDSLNRSELYSLANEELGLDWQWSGDSAMNEEEMREALRELINDKLE